MSETEKKARTTLIKKPVSQENKQPSTSEKPKTSAEKKFKFKIKPQQPEIQKVDTSQETKVVSPPVQPTAIEMPVIKNTEVKTHINPNRRIPMDTRSKSTQSQSNTSRSSDSSNDRNQQHAPRFNSSSSRKEQSTAETSSDANKGKYMNRTNRTGSGFSNDSSKKPQSSPTKYENTRTNSQPKTGVNKQNREGGNTAPTSSTTTGSKRTFKATRKKQFVNKRRQFVEKNIHVSRNKKHAPVVVANPVPKSISIMESISVVDLAKKMNLKSSELLSKLMAMGMMANLNTIIDYETAQLLASEYNCEISVVTLYDQTLIESKNTVEAREDARPPVVTIMGHVDHGKTTLIDCLRKSKVAEGEQGQITQHLGAYMIDTGRGKITMLDTPGHEAFTLMRSRGAQVTDIILLVIAADDGIKPQTIEAISHAKSANVPIIVALNKIDSPASNPERVLQQLAEQELMPEEWGGDVPVYKISALKNEGIDNLLSHISIQAELMNVHANNLEPAKGVVLESKMEKGKGIVISVLIKTGVLRLGDFFVSGIYPGKVRDMIDDMGNNLSEATPSMPVAIVGLDGMPDAGDPFEVTDNDKNAKQVSAKRQELNKITLGENIKKITVDTMYDSIEEDNTNTLRIIIKGDVHGSVEAIKEALEKLSQEDLKVKVLNASAGAINVGDIQLAAASSAMIIGFNVRPTIQVQRSAAQEKVVIQRYSLIYDVINGVKKQLEGMLKPIYQEEKTGEAIVREIFSVPRFGVIAGSYIESGNVRKDSIIKVIRNNKEIHSGNVSSLRRFKDTVNSVETGYECGIGVENTSDLQEGDQLVIYKKVVVARTLDSN